MPNAGSITWANESKLKIDYQFKNKTTKAAFLFDGVFRSIGSDSFDYSKDIVAIEFEGRSLVIGKKISAVPKGMLVETKITPLSS